MLGIRVTPGIFLCILLIQTCALPLQTNTGGDQDSDETDSDEEENTTAKSVQQNQNVTDEELTNKATLFLHKYFTNHGTEEPLHIPTNLNHTIVITIVPNNATQQQYETGGLTFEGTPTFGGDIPLFQPQGQYQQGHFQQQYQQEQFQQQQYQQEQFQQQQQYQQEQFQQPYQEQFQQQYQQEQTTVSEPQQSKEPVKRLFGYVPADQVPSVVARESTESPKTESPSQDLLAPSTTEAVDTTTQTAPSAKEKPVDNIEDAILEALSIAGGEGGQGIPSTTEPTPTQAANANYQALIESGAIPGLGNNNGDNGGIIKVPSNFGTVFIQTDDQSTHVSNTYYSTETTIAPPPPPPPLIEPEPTVAAPVVRPNIMLLQQILQQTNNKGNYPVQQRPQVGEAVSNIIGSLSQGNLAGLVQNTVRLAETPELQNVAKVATVAVLHNVFQGLNPCNFLGCGAPRPAPAALKIK